MRIVEDYAALAANLEVTDTRRNDVPSLDLGIKASANFAKTSERKNRQISAVKQLAAIQTSQMYHDV